MNPLHLISATYAAYSKLDLCRAKLIKYISNHPGTQTEKERICGFGRGNYRKYITGNEYISTDKLIKAVEKLHHHSTTPVDTTSP